MTAAITMAPVSQPRSHRIAAVMAVAFLAMAAAMAVLLWNTFSSDEPRSGRVVSEAPTDVAPTASTPSTEAAAASVAATASSTIPEPSESVSAVPTRKAPPAPPKVWRPPGTAKPNCTPPWEIDENGHRRYKRECLR